LVSPADAIFTAETTIKSREHQPTNTEIESKAFIRSQQYQPLSFESSEVAISVGSRLTVLGELSEYHGQMAIQAPEKGSFLISHKSDQLMKRELRSTQITGWVAGS